MKAVQWDYRPGTMRGLRHLATRCFRRSWALASQGAAACRAELRELWRGDPRVVRLLIAFWVFEAAGMLWDLPGAYGWENDGAAPRDFLAGLAENLTPGAAHRYPLLH